MAIRLMYGTSSSLHSAAAMVQHIGIGTNVHLERQILSKKFSGWPWSAQISCYYNIMYSSS